MNLESENVIVAIGVLGVLSKLAYGSDAGLVNEPVYKALRTVIAVLNEELERIAIEEVQR